ncbi:hypothetical protein [Pseudomonas syringae]|uniref:hypothetical protein n=1 Tax=Pseudomonas syringae TaxID=317 RepID=UPI001C67F09B|nr:hypothetical protein [Pseudomonas syringae]
MRLLMLSIKPPGVVSKKLGYVRIALPEYRPPAFIVSAGEPPQGQRCLTLRAAHYTRRRRIRGSADKCGLFSAKKPAQVPPSVKSANNAQGAHHRSYAIMRPEIRGASDEQHRTKC